MFWVNLFSEKVQVSAKTKHKGGKIHRLYFIEERCKISSRLQFIYIQIIDISGINVYNVEEPNSSSKHGVIVKVFSLTERNLVF